MINDLIAKLEAAAEGSRKLDGLIAQYLGLPHGPWEKVYIKSRSIAYGDEKARYYTTSLDAAMTLVPEGVDIMFEIEHVMGGPCVYVRVGQGGAIAPARGDSDGSILVTRMGGTYYKKNGPRVEATWGEAIKLLPVAVCTAALKARSQS